MERQRRPSNQDEVSQLGCGGNKNGTKSCLLSSPYPLHHQVSPNVEEAPKGAPQGRHTQEGPFPAEAVPAPQPLAFGLSLGWDATISVPVASTFVQEMNCRSAHTVPRGHWQCPGDLGWSLPACRDSTMRKWPRGSPSGHLIPPGRKPQVGTKSWPPLNSLSLSLTLFHTHTHKTSP